MLITLIRVIRPYEAFITISGAVVPEHHARPLAPPSRAVYGVLAYKYPPGVVTPPPCCRVGAAVWVLLPPGSGWHCCRVVREVVGSPLWWGRPGSG